MQMPATALFPDRHSVYTAVDQLAQAGFARNELSIAMSEETHEREFGGAPSRSGIRTPMYGILGAIVSSLTAHAVPGFALRVAGPLLATLTQAGALSVALLALGMAERQATAVREGLARGSIIVGVHAGSDRVKLAHQLLELAGGSTLQAA